VILYVALHGQEGIRSHTFGGKEVSLKNMVLSVKLEEARVQVVEGQPGVLAIKEYFGGMRVKIEVHELLGFLWPWKKRQSEISPLVLTELSMELRSLVTIQEQAKSQARSWAASSPWLASQKGRIQLDKESQQRDQSFQFPVKCVCGEYFTMSDTYIEHLLSSGHAPANGFSAWLPSFTTSSVMNPQLSEEDRMNTQRYHKLLQSTRSLAKSSCKGLQDLYCVNLPEPVWWYPGTNSTNVPVGNNAHRLKLQLFVLSRNHLFQKCGLGPYSLSPLHASSLLNQSVLVSSLFCLSDMPVQEAALGISTDGVGVVELALACGASHLPMIKQLSKKFIQLGLPPLPTYARKTWVEVPLRNTVHFAVIGDEDQAVLEAMKSSISTYMTNVQAQSSETNPLYNFLLHQDGLGMTPLALACALGKLEAVKWILKYAEDAFSELSSRGTSTTRGSGRIAIPPPLAMYKTSICGDTPVMLALQFGYDSVAMELLNWQLLDLLQVNAQNRDGHTAFHFACRFGFLDIVKTLLTSEIGTEKDGDSNTVLHLAIQSGNSDLVLFLLEKLPKTKIQKSLIHRNKDGKSALDLIKDSTNEAMGTIQNKIDSILGNKASEEAAAAVQSPTTCTKSISSDDDEVAEDPDYCYNSEGIEEKELASANDESSQNSLEAQMASTLSGYQHHSETFDLKVAECAQEILSYHEGGESNGEDQLFGFDIPPVMDFLKLVRQRSSDGEKLHHFASMPMNSTSAASEILTLHLVKEESLEQVREEEAKSPGLGAAEYFFPVKRKINGIWGLEMSELPEYMTAIGGENAIAQERMKVIDGVASCLSIPTRTSAMLLSTYMWDTNALISDFIEDAEQVLQKCGIVLVEPFNEPTSKQETSERQTCPVCYELYEQSNMYRAPICGHRGCLSCWGAHLQSTADKFGPSAPIEGKCLLHPQCRVALDEETWEACAEAELFKSYRRWLLRSFVRLKEGYLWCPNPQGCDWVLQSNAHLLGRADEYMRGDVRCLACAYRCCEHCAGPAHTPATCVEVSVWQDFCTAKADEASVRLLMKNFKRCPKCKIFIEKNHGCNHMTCRREAGGCGYEFCWVCAGEYGSCSGSCQQLETASWNIEQTVKVADDKLPDSEGAAAVVNGLKMKYWELSFQKFCEPDQNMAILKFRLEKISINKAEKSQDDEQLQILWFVLDEIYDSYRFLKCFIVHLYYLHQTLLEGKHFFGSHLEEAKMAIERFEFQAEMLRVNLEKAMLIINTSESVNFDVRAAFRTLSVIQHQCTKILEEIQERDAYYGSPQPIKNYILDMDDQAWQLQIAKDIHSELK